MYSTHSDESYEKGDGSASKEGSGGIYDGSFSGTLVPGFGVAAEALRDAGIAVFGESGAGDLINDPRM